MRNPSKPTVNFKLVRESTKTPPLFCDFHWQFTDTRNGINVKVDEHGYAFDVAFNIWSPKRWKAWFDSRPFIVNLRKEWLRRWMIEKIHQGHGKPSDLLLWDGTDPSAARRAEDYKISTSFFHRGKW